MAAALSTATIRPFLIATPPFSITRRVPSIVTTVPPLTIMSTVLFLFCANADDALPEIDRTSKSEAMHFVIIVFPELVTLGASRLSRRYISRPQHSVQNQLW